MNIPAKAANERFQSGVDQYAAYLETPEGRLRSDLVFANLQAFLPMPEHNRSLHILDLGCGTGTCAVRLAGIGFHVTLLDSSSAMLDIAKGAAREARVSENLVFEHGDVADAAKLFPLGAFDAVLCHNVLEYVKDPATVVTAASRLIKENKAVLSILVRSRAGEVLKTAIRGGDLAAADRSLTSEYGVESLFGGPVRLFTTESLQAMLPHASLEVIAHRGVRVIADYLPPQTCRNAEYEQVFELERKLGLRSEFAAIARYGHYLLRRTPQRTEEGA